MNWAKLLSVCALILAVCCVLSVTSRYLPTKRGGAGALPAMADYDQDLYPVPDLLLPGGSDSDLGGIYSINGRLKPSNVIGMPVLRRPRNHPEAYYSRW